MTNKKPIDFDSEAFFQKNRILHIEALIHSLPNKNDMRAYNNACHELANRIDREIRRINKKKSINMNNNGE